MKSSRSGLYILITCWLTYITAYLCRVNFSSALAKMSDDLGVSVELLGVSSFVYFITYAVGQLINGFIGDRVKPYRFVILALCITAGMNLLMTYVQSLWQIVIVWGLNGYFQSIFWSTILRLLSFYFTSEDQHRTVSTMMSTCSIIGYILSWTLLGKIFVPFSWKIYFMVPSLCAIALIPFWIAAVIRLPMEQLLQQRIATPPLSRGIREIIEDKLYLVCLLSGCIGAVQEGAIFWLPLIFMQVLDLEINSSLILLMIVPLARILGIITARFLLERYKNDIKKTELMLLSLASIISISLAVFSNSSSLIEVFLIGLLIWMLNGSKWIIISYLPFAFSQRNMVSTLVGVFDFSTYIGAAVSSSLFGFVLERFGWNLIPVVWCVFVILSLLLVLTGAGVCLERKEKRINECS